MTHTARVTRMHVIPRGVPLYDERGFSVEIDDDAGGEFVVVNCHDDQCKAGQIRIDPEEWKAVRDAIDVMVKECKE